MLRVSSFTFKPLNLPLTTGWAQPFLPLHRQAPGMKPRNGETYWALAQHIISVAVSKGRASREPKHASGK